MPKVRLTVDLDVTSVDKIRPFIFENDIDPSSLASALSDGALSARMPRVEMLRDDWSSYEDDEEESQSAA